MARSGLRIHVRYAPDLTALVGYVEQTMDRFRDAEVIRDPRVCGLMREFEAARPTALCESTFDCGTLTVEPGDELLRLVAKMRAVERVVLSS